MTEARSIAKELRVVMNKHRWTIHDIMRGLVVIANGRLKQETKVEIQACVS